jgi:dipeptidyl aminopeptidase/acylaminoacyl peptidase
MSNSTIRPYGLWDSPISPRSLSTDKRLSDVQWDSDGQTLVWLEGRSDRGVLVAQSLDGDAPRDLTSELSVRAEVGYGGGDFAVHRGNVYFAVHKQGRLYRLPLAGGAATPITPAFGKAAAPVVSHDGRFVAYVHHDEQQIDRVAVVDTQGHCWPQVLTSGHDFYMQPRFSPDGKWFCWIAWDHPNMPWDGTLLYLAEVVQQGDNLPRLASPRVVAGGSDVAIFQPEFTPDGKSLVFVSDETGFGRIAVLDLANGKQRWLTPDGVEYFRPAWQQGARCYTISSDSRSVLGARNDQGVDRLERIGLQDGSHQPLEPLAGYTDVSQIGAAAHGNRLALVASAPRIPPRVIAYDLANNTARIAARAAGEMTPVAALAECQPISWKTAGGEAAYGLFYAPHSDRFASQSGKPPLLVLVHGGPTGQAKAAWNPMAQFFATRGYAVLSVNYRGSTGYGRQYMLRLRGNWGVCDVEDCVSGARHLADAGAIDSARTVIVGGSAGGFTVLQTMVTQPDAFAAGVSMYGVANQFSLAADTHKFEARYLDTMLGPLPEAAAVYRARSPIYHAAAIKRPLAVFQGDIDLVVPREQSDSIVEALKRNGTPHVYHVYEGEGHGWRKTETIVHFYQAVEDFLQKFVLFA